MEVYMYADFITNVSHKIVRKSCRVGFYDPTAEIVHGFHHH